MEWIHYSSHKDNCVAGAGRNIRDPSTADGRCWREDQVKAMELRPRQVISTDVLVLGSGGAGLRAAIEARKHNVRVLLVSKARAGIGNNTAISGSGIAAGTGWRDSNDSPESHLKDTIIGGRYIGNQRLVDVMTLGIGQQVLELESFGVRFRKRAKAFHMALMAGHTYPRNVFGDSSIGTDLTLPLRDYASSLGVELVERMFISRLLTRDNAVTGAMGVDEVGDIHMFNAKSTILAMGGAGHIYSRTNNAVGSTGDGFVLAYEAGVPMIDMEFVQFITSGPNAEMFCAREGAVIRNCLGDNILDKYGISDPIRMTRDAIGRAMMMEVLGGRSSADMTLTLDTTPISEKRFEALRVLLPKNAPPSKRHFSLGLQSHFFMGGARTDENAETGVDGLYATGEVCGGVHGANRLGGNALAEVFVFGKIAGERAAQRALVERTALADPNEFSVEAERLRRLASSGSESAKELQLLLKTIMWNGAGTVRDEKGLRVALEGITSFKERLHNISVESHRDLVETIRLGNMRTVSEMVLRSALFRTESRGAHYRADYPVENNKEWLTNITISKKNGGMSLSVVPVDAYRIIP